MKSCSATTFFVFTHKNRLCFFNIILFLMKVFFIKIKYIQLNRTQN